MNGSHPDLSKCTGQELTDINDFSNYTRNALREFYDQQPENRTVWSPACPFHGNQHFGVNEDPGTIAWQVPEFSGNTLGFTLHAFYFNDMKDAYIDDVDWPENSLCAHIY